MFESRIEPPYGLQGGKAGLPFRVTLHHAVGGSRELSGRENLPLAVGDRVVIETSGGGGYGAPALGADFVRGCLSVFLLPVSCGAVRGKSVSITCSPRPR